MKHLTNYNLFINESKNDNKEVYDIIDILQEIIDEGYNPIFKSNNSDMRYSDYLEKNNKYTVFKPVYKAGNKIKSKFTIVFHSLNYDRLVSLMDEMISVKGRLEDNEWVMSDLKIGNTYDDIDTNGRKIIQTYISYQFSKPDEILDDSERANKEDILKAFEGILHVEESNIRIYDDDYVTVGFDALTYDGKLPSFESMENIFTKICDTLGFSEYEYIEGEWGVTFWF
jgi:hypothetical protein